MTNGIEWNYLLCESEDPIAFSHYFDAFENMFLYDSYPMTKAVVEEYRNGYRISSDKRAKERINNHYDSYNKRLGNKATDLTGQVAESTASYMTDRKRQLFTPNPAQREALMELENTRLEGNEKALVVAATGIGKTYLAAFDSQNFENILFVAHREEILNQAKATFASVRGEKGLGRLYAGYKEYDADILFASVQSLKNATALQAFDRNRFNYLIVDEIHHGTAPSYKRIIDHFEPDFMLGLTATPYRMDQQDVFELCDYNCVYEANLFSAINRGWLVPYRYYGIYDVTVDYGKISYINGKYVEKELEQALSINTRAELILKHYKRYRRHRTLAFCSSIEHAEYMAGYFNGHGVKSICIHSNQNTTHYEDRNLGLAYLENNDIDVVFSVDMLNEGVDIPSLDMLLFLRPTESPTVFLQQLGRGLRKHNGKHDVRILDFIGNFKKVDLIPFLLSEGWDGKKGVKDLENQELLPEGCQVDFEFEVVDLIDRAIRSQIGIKDRIKTLYLECKEENGNIPPTRMQFFTWLSGGQFLQVRKNAKINPFKNYIGTTNEWNNLEADQAFLVSTEYQVIQYVEKTSMSQLYKLPVLLSFIKEDRFEDHCSKQELINTFKDFYKNNRNRMDIERNKSMTGHSTFSDEQWWKVIKGNPIHFMSRTNSELFELREDTFWIKSDFEWSAKSIERQNWFVEQVKDAIDFRRNEFLAIRLEDKL